MVTYLFVLACCFYDNAITNSVLLHTMIWQLSFNYSLVFLYKRKIFVLVVIRNQSFTKGKQNFMTKHISRKLLFSELFSCFGFFKIMNNGLNKIPSRFWTTIKLHCTPFTHLQLFLLYSLFINLGI